ncbi:MAG: transposase [Alloprevotella tannerae]
MDLGIKDLCITSNGKKYENPKTIKKYEKKLAKLQRQLAGKTKGSGNYQKKRKEIALCHEKITNTKGQAKRMLLQNSYFSAGRLLSGEQRRPAALSSAFS